MSVTTPVAQKNHAVALRTSTRCVPGLAESGEKLDPERMAVVFKALGSPTRLRLLAAVQATPDGEACVCHLVDFVGLTQSTVSHHLSVLVDAGLVRREQRGTWAWYALVPESLDAVRELLAIPGESAR